MLLIDSCLRRMQVVVLSYFPMRQHSALAASVTRPSFLSTATTIAGSHGQSIERRSPSSTATTTGLPTSTSLQKILAISFSFYCLVRMDCLCAWLISSNCTSRSRSTNQSALLSSAPSASPFCITSSARCPTPAFRSECAITLRVGTSQSDL